MVYLKSQKWYNKVRAEGIEQYELCHHELTDKEWEQRAAYPRNPYRMTAKGYLCTSKWDDVARTQRHAGAILPQDSVLTRQSIAVFVAGEMMVH